MPVIVPFWLAVNFTPTLTELVSPEEGCTGSVVSGQIEHGHWPGGGLDCPVVKLHVSGPDIGVPVATLVAPDTVAVYVVLGASGPGPPVSPPDGTNVAVSF